MSSPYRSSPPSVADHEPLPDFRRPARPRDVVFVIAFGLALEGFCMYREGFKVWWLVAYVMSTALGLLGRRLAPGVRAAWKRRYSRRVEAAARAFEARVLAETNGK